MTLRSKLTLMFFGALQVTFLTAVGTFWAVQSWQLLTDDLTLIHDQNLRLEDALEAPTAGTPGRGAAYVRSLRRHAQTLTEANLIDGFDAARTAADAAAATSAAQRLKRYYHGQVKRLRERSHFVTRLSTGLLVAIVTLVLTG
jgi:hypothetical protein